MEDSLLKKVMAIGQGMQYDENLWGSGAVEMGAGMRGGRKKGFPCCWGEREGGVGVQGSLEWLM